MKRIPHTENKTLQAWNAADELLINEVNSQSGSRLIFNDRFGFLTKHSANVEHQSYILYKSQLDSIMINCDHMDRKSLHSACIHFPQSPEKAFDQIIIHAPKSMELLDFYLKLASQCINNTGVVYLGFMTRHFNKKMLALCEFYFTEVEQSKAVKKARLIKMQLPNENATPLIASLKTKINTFNTTMNLNRYIGTFSAEKIDVASYFLMKQLNINKDVEHVLDIGSGNGILSMRCRALHPTCNLHLLDDSLAAYLSGIENLDDEHTHHYWAYDLNEFKDETFDLIISNPPFHFEHEIDLSIPFNLLKQSIKKLKKGGQLMIVANNHINYPKVLQPFVSEGEIVKRNEKFYIYKAKK